jgi:hypothetical protein
MKTLLLAALIVMMAGAFDGICPVCKKEGQKSTVTVGTCTSTLMFCGSGYYDEQGDFVPPSDCNHTSCSYRCSRGHEFTDGMKSMLKALGDNTLDYPKDLLDTQDN